MTIAAVLIVKNEAAVIERCLESVKPHISSWTIVDTGSTDGTQDIIRRVLDGIPGRLLELPFVNFGHSRSEAFAAAYGTADWLFALDADMTVEMGSLKLDPEVDAYMLKMQHGDIDYRLPLILNGHRQWKSVGAVHEYTVMVDGNLGRRLATDSVRFVHHGAARSTPEKSAWHAQLLEAELERNPEDARTVFYLAQTYRDLGDARAVGLYSRRGAMGGFEEEAFYARYQAAALLGSWEQLVEAWETRPDRLEPLHDAVRILNQGDRHHAAYALASYAVDRESLGFGQQDVLFVRRWIWEWGLRFQLSIAAWWVGRPDECAHISRRLLAIETLPPDVRAAVERNLALCVAAAA